MCLEACVLSDAYAVRLTSNTTTLPHCFPALGYLTLIASRVYRERPLQVSKLPMVGLARKLKTFGLSSLENHLGSGNPEGPGLCWGDAA